MFICNECGKIFKEPIIKYDDPSPDGVSLPQGYYYCPYCGSDDIEEL